MPGFSLFVGDFRSKAAVLAAKKQEWIACTHHHVFHFGDEDGVIASILRRLQSAL
jgi:hypothetical protein